MQGKFKDDFSTTHGTFSEMFTYHKELASNSIWERTSVNTLEVFPASPGMDVTSFPGMTDNGITDAALEDCIENLGLVIKWSGEYFPLRITAFKSLLDRAKIGGTALPKLSREDLAQTINACLKLHSAAALLLLREQKISAVHSGDIKDYSILPIDELLAVIGEKLEERFLGNEFKSGYSDHSYTCACWTFPAQAEELLSNYKKALDSIGRGALAKRFVPGIRFSTSDTGFSSAKVAGLIFGSEIPVRIGSVLEVDHRGQKKIENFANELDMLFSQFGDTIKKLEKLIEITLEYPVNAMTAVCKKLSLPKKAALEAIEMFSVANGLAPATAHDVFMALQEIMFVLKTEKTPESKLLVVEENLSRALSIKWSDYDYAKAVSY